MGKAWSYCLNSASQPVLRYNTTTRSMFFGNILKYFYSSDDSSTTIQQHGDREEDQEVNVVHNGEGNKHQVAQTDNAHSSEDSKTSFRRVTSNTDLSQRKGSVGFRQGTRKLDGRNRKDRLPANTCLQCLTVAKENTGLKTQLEAGRQDLGKVNKQSTELERRMQRLVGEKEALQAKANAESDRLGREQTEAKMQIRDLQGKNQKLEEDLNILKVTLRGVQDNHLNTVKLLEERTADLKGAQTFLTTADRYAGAEILKMVEALNAEIFQGGALVSELLGDGNAFDVDGRRRNYQSTRVDRDHLTQFIGPKLAEHLSTKSKQVQVDPFPLQLAVQAILTRWCVFMVDSFYPDPTGSDLKEIYRRIWESEPQAVAGRWRAMMSKQAKLLDSTTENGAQQVVEMLFNLLCLCGSPISNTASQQTRLRLHQVVSTILNMWMQLRTAIHEGVTTTEMEVFCSSSNDMYQDKVMTDIYADPGDVQQPDDLGRETGRILCTVGMGLKRSVIRQKGDGTMYIQSDIILKGKVAFPSVLFDSE